MTFHHGQPNQQPQRSNAQKHHQNNMQSQVYHNGGFRPVNKFPSNHQGANTNSIGNPYHQMNSSVVQGFQQYGPTNSTTNGNMHGNHQGQSFASQSTPMMQQQFLPFQQGQFMYCAPQLTPAQLAYKKFKAEKPLRLAVLAFRAQQMHERANKWDQDYYEKKQWLKDNVWNTPEYKNYSKTIEEWEKEETRDWPRFKFAALDKGNKEYEAAIKRLEAAKQEEREAVIQEGRKPSVTTVKNSHFSVHSERMAEYEELFGDHRSRLGPNDALYAPTTSVIFPVANGPPAAQPSASPTQDTIKRVVKRGREEDIVDDHIVKRLRPAAIDTSTMPPVSSAEAEPQRIPDTLDTPQANLAEENPKRTLKRSREEDVEEERDVERPRQETVAFISPHVSADGISSSPGPAASGDAISESLQAPSSPEIETPRKGTAILPVNHGASFTKIDLSNSDDLDVAQPSFTPARLPYSSPGSTPSASAIPHVVPTTIDTSRASPVVASTYSSPVSTCSPGLSSDAGSFSPVSPLSSNGSVEALPSNKKRSRQSDDESDEAPPVKRQYIRAKSLKIPTGLATATIHTPAAVAQVADATPPALSPSISASSCHDETFPSFDDGEEEF